MTWPEFLLWGDAIGSFIAGSVNFLMVRSGRPYPLVKLLRGVLAYAYTALYVLLILGINQTQGVVFGRSLALGCWPLVWIVPALLPPTHNNVEELAERVVERMKRRGDPHLD